MLFVLSCPCFVLQLSQVKALGVEMGYDVEREGIQAAFRTGLFDSLLPPAIIPRLYPLNIVSQLLAFSLSL